MIDGHMRYQDVMELTPWQIVILLTEKPDMPGKLSRETLDEIMKTVPENWEELQ